MTAMRSARRFVTALSVAVSTVLTACGGSEGGGGITQPPPPPVLTVISMTVTTVTGDTILRVPNSTSLRAVARLSNDVTSEVTSSSEVTWVTSNPVLATVSTGGLVTALAPGRVTVTASYKGVTGSIQIRIDPDGTPWDQLVVKTTLDERRVIIDSVLTGGMIAGWTKDTISVWLGGLHVISDSDRSAALDSARKFWREHTNKVFVAAKDSVSADVRGYHRSNLPAGRCSQGGPAVPDVPVAPGVISAGIIEYAPNLECFRWFFVDLTHHLGHILGIARHIPQCNIMGYPCASWEATDLFKVAAKIVTLVPPGTKPI